MSDRELRTAINSIVDLLSKTKIQEAVTQFRTALVNKDVSQPSSQLLVSSNKLIEGLHSLGALELKVWKYMHLEQLGLPQYFNDIISLKAGYEETRAEVVQVYSRIMFATNHLPGIIKLLDAHLKTESRSATADGNDLLEIKLYDAGEKASDPDRISRTLDGVDMLYAACVNLSKKPAVDLSLIRISGDANRHIQFEGDYDAISSIKVIIDSIADGISDIEDINNFSPDQIVSDLPVFTNLARLQEMGNFRDDEIAQISESIHEGCSLIMESGVMLEQSRFKKIPKNSANTQTKNKSAKTPHIQTVVKTVPVSIADHAAKVSVKRIDAEEPKPIEQNLPKTDRDERNKPKDPSPHDFYRAYLKEKNKKLNAQSEPEVKPTSSSEPTLLTNISDKTKEPGSKEDALGELILDLNKITHK